MPYPSLQELPTSREHWRATAIGAAGLLMIDDARRLELIAGGPDIDRGRCDEILALAAAQGIVVGVDQAATMGLEILAAFEAEAHDA